MELENILKNYLNEEIVTENTMLSITNLEKKSKDYEEDLEDEDMKDYEEEDEEEDDEDEDEDEDDEDEDDEEEDEDDEEYTDIDIETISDMEKIKIVLDILNHIKKDYDGLDDTIITLQDIIDENSY